MHAITEGFKSIFRSFWLSITAITVLFVSLTSVFIMVALRTAVGTGLDSLDKQVTINFYVANNIEAEDIPDIQRELEKLSNVSKVEFFPRDDYADDFYNDPNVDQIFAETVRELSKEMGENILQSYFRISTDSSENHNKVLDNLLADTKFDPVVNYLSDGTKDIKGAGDTAEILQSVYFWINIVTVALIIIFSIISALVIANVLRLSIYTSKEEISVMRLVGGTDGYIQGPFIFQVIFYTFIASSILAALAVPGIYFWLPEVSSIIFESGVEIDLEKVYTQIYSGLAIIIGSAFFLSYLISYLTTKKYMDL